jgi:hypothetical protein
LSSEPAEAEPCPAHRAPDGPDHPAHRAKTTLLHDNRHRLLNDDGLPHNGDALLDHDGAGTDEAAAEPPGLSGRGVVSVSRVKAASERAIGRTA